MEAKLFLPFVQDASMVVNKISAEGTKRAQEMVWYDFRRKHDALQQKQVIYLFCF